MLAAAVPLTIHRPTAQEPAAATWLDRALACLHSPVDISSLCLFRFGFGWMMAWWAWDYLTSGRVQFLYLTPQFHFTYYLFDWVRPWPGAGMYMHFLAIVLLGLCVSLGFWYRLASALLAICFTYVFLLDATNYQNHYYLLILICWSLPLLPLADNYSIDAALQPALHRDTAPGWTLWLLRFHIALPYFFGGVAKLDADWLTGLPMQQMLAPHASLPLIGGWLQSHSTALLFSWGGMCFDLAIVPLLIFPRTRLPAYLLCVLFHVMNSMLFQIHIFPWFMIFATTLFFRSDWPRRALRGERVKRTETEPVAWKLLPLSTRLRFTLLFVYCAFHIVWPVRHRLYAGDVNWTERGHLFSWRMMVRGKTAGVRYFISEPATGKTWHPNLRPLINADQAGRFSRDPEMILHLAHFLAEQHRRQTGRELEVRALVLTSLNGRKPEVFIDPQVNLAGQPRGFHHRTWVLPQTEPLRVDPWSVPLVEWERHIKLPTPSFLQHPAPPANAGAQLRS